MVGKETMTSLEIAEVTGRNHNYVMRCEDDRDA